MRKENNQLILERKNCDRCSPNNGQVCSMLTCRTCNGTGKGKRGKVGGCRACFGSTQEVRWDIPIPCPHCNGNYQNVTPETFTDSLPEGMFASLEFRVIRSMAQMSMREQVFGVGVYSCVDYGTAFKQTDEEIIAEVKLHRGVQACSVVNSKGEFCSFVAIVVKPQGFSVVAAFEDLAKAA